MAENVISRIAEIDNYDVASIDLEETNFLFGKMDSYASAIYKFVLIYTDYINTKRDYGTGEELSMMEAHVLTDIADNPSITVTELAKSWVRTTSAISQTVRKLINKDLVYRVNSKEDAKVFMLYPTERALEFSFAHKKYDILDIIKTNKRLMHKFTEDEINIFHNVLEEYTNLLKEGK